MHPSEFAYICLRCAFGQLQLQTGVPSNSRCDAVMPAAPRSGGGADRLGMLTDMFEAAATPPTAGLRFRFGDRVICNVGKTGCIPGTVTQLHYREGTISTSPYQVMLDNDYWPCSSDDHECDHECDQHFVFSSQDTDNVTFASSLRWLCAISIPSDVHI